MRLKFWSTVPLPLQYPALPWSVYVPTFLGSGTNRGQSPVEWGDFLYVHPYFRPPPLGHPARPEAQPASQASVFRPGWLGLRPDWLGLRTSWMALREDGWTDGKFPHSTGPRPLSGQLHCFIP